MQEAIVIRPLNGTAAQICQLIGGYFIKTKKEWGLMDQRWMLDKLDKWYGHRMQRSVLCYNLKQLVEAGYLNRVTRHRKNPETGEFEPRPTLYKMTFKLKCFILRLASYMRGIGWKNHITAPVRAAHAAARLAAKAAAAAREAAMPRMSKEQFMTSWRAALGVT